MKKARGKSRKIHGKGIRIVLYTHQIISVFLLKGNAEGEKTDTDSEHVTDLKSGKLIKIISKICDVCCHTYHCIDLRKYFFVQPYTRICTND